MFIQDLQFDAIKGTILHADFLAVTDETVLTAKLPVVLKGEPKGIKLGGALEQLVHTLKVKALPNDLPQQIDADVTDLDISESLTIGDITFPSGVTPTLHDKVLVALVAMTRAAKSAGGEGEARSIAIGPYNMIRLVRIICIIRNQFLLNGIFL